MAVPLMTPAWACGCGAYDPAVGGHASVPVETALVRDEAGAEDVYLSLTVDSTARAGALLFPVPDRHATVKAGPAGLFDDLAALTAPEPSSGRLPGGKNGAPPPVSVENRQQIGPLDVVTLASSDATALTAWLQHNGFAAKPTLATAAQPYIDAGWAFIAVRLRPGASGQILNGRLDPLQIHFATDQPVYPMRLSAMASQPERGHPYFLGPHRIQLRTADPGLTQTWASHLAGYHEGPALAAVVGNDQDYLTRFDGTLDPHRISDDIHFATAPTDTASTRRHSSGDTPTGLYVGIGVAVILFGLLGWLIARRRVRPN